MDSNSTQRRPYAEAFDTLVSATASIETHHEPGRDLWFRPGQVLCAIEDADAVVRAARKVLPDLAEDVKVVPSAGGTATLQFRPGSPVLAIVTRLREPRVWGEGRVPVIQPNHVTVGYPRTMGHPAEPPSLPAGPPSPPDAALRHVGRGVTVGVCDTGIWAKAPGAHPAWFAGQYHPETDDIDSLAADSGHLALQAGHGTFVGGIVRSTAPGVRLDPEVALEPSGLGDEVMLAEALENLEPGVEIVNLSLGCLTLDNLPSLPIARALDTLDRGVVVVAAAGNSGHSRPHWPAAFKRVIGVASIVQDDQGALVADPDSNYGPWVDACAPGTHVATFVTGTTLPVLGEVTFGQPYALWSGTSFAAPVVAGRIAELMTRHGVTAPRAAAMLLDHPRWHPDYGVLVL